MDILNKIRAEFVDIVEWLDDTQDTMVWRFDRFQNEIKYGAQLVVRPAQAAVFVNEGRIADVYQPGRYSLTTRNMPVLTTIRGWKYGFNSPFKSEVYFASTRNFTDLKWGTKNPVILRDAEFGPVRLRAFGTYVIRVKEPARFIEQIVGTDGLFTTDEIAEQLKNLIVTRFSDLVAESKIPVLDLAANYDELSDFMTAKIGPEFLEYGIEVTKLLVENISLPDEVAKALDKRSSMGIVGNLDQYFKFQSANAMEAAAKNPGGDASAGIGMGMGFAMASQMGQMIGGQRQGAAGDGGPPPLPGTQEKQYYVGQGGQRNGPFAADAIVKMIRDGTVSRDSLVWRHGMADWQRADQLQEFGGYFGATPPPLPT